jgi:WhiB family redox-sensing transcriptional regulator
MNLAWRLRAKCSGKQDLFFARVTVFNGPQIEQAKAICAACPVTKECLQVALDTREWLGIWGGLLPQERRNLLAAKETVTRLRAAVDGVTRPVLPAPPLPVIKSGG